jgi:hypothetical protein
LIYLPAHACGCHGSAKLNGFLALANRSASDAPSLDDSAPAARLEKGPAFDRAAANAKPAITDWPVYKHDNLRSNGTAAAVPSRLAKPWSVDVGGQLTAPTIADGRVYVASTDQHTVHCLDADTGTERWQFVADGRVDTPPTCHGSQVLFGTRSGSVYALDAGQGQLAWRFRAAPADTRLVSHGQLESAWPVNGTVFVQQDKAYVVAGRSTNLDGGLFACVLDVRSGEVLQTAQYQADTRKTGEVDGAVLSDILVGDTQRILIRDKQIDPADIALLASSNEDTLLRTRSGGLLDASWYNSAAWEYLQTRAQMLVFDDRVLVGLSAYRVQSQKSYPHDVLSVGDGYLLSAVSPIAGRDDGGKSAAKGKADRRAPSLQSPWRRLWQTVIPVRVNAMILADRTLCVAGAPDIADPQDPWGAFEDRQGGVLMLISKEDGQVVAKTELDSSPVYDGMAAAGGKLYLSLRNGSLVCF